MTASIRNGGAALLFALAATHAAAQNPPLQPQPGEIVIGPVQVQETVQGVNLTLPTSAFFTLSAVGDKIQIDARVVADLSALQRNLAVFLGSVQLPSDPCGFAVRIPSQQLLAVGWEAVLDLHGDITLSGCVFGRLLTRVTQPFDADLPFTLEVANPQTVTVRSQEPHLTLNGPLAGAFQLLLGLFGVDLDARIKSAIDAEALANRLQVTIPEDLRPLGITVTQADFASDGAVLDATLHASVTVDAQTLGQLIQTLLAAGQPEPA